MVETSPMPAAVKSRKKNWCRFKHWVSSVSAKSPQGDSWMLRQFTLPIRCYCRSRCLISDAVVFISSATANVDRNTHQWRNSKCYDRGRSALLIKMLGKWVFVCICALGGGGNRGQENHIHMVEQLHRAQFAKGFYPQNNHSNTSLNNQNTLMHS